MVLKRLLLAAVCLCAANVRADDFQNFRIPRHKVMSLSVAADGWYNTSLYRPIGGREEISNWSGSATSDFFHLTESDRFLSQVRIEGDLAGWSERRTSRRTTSDSSQNRGHDNREHVREMLGAEWLGRAYPWTVPVGLQLSLYGTAYWEQGWESQTWTDTYPSSDYTSTADDEVWYYHYSASGSIMAGWGRVRDASGIYEARVMEQRLVQSGVIEGGLQSETIQRLAELIYRRDDFSYQHERHPRYYWREVENVLKGDPAFHADRFDAYNLNLAGDWVFPISFNYRPVGYFVGPQVELRHTNDFSRYWHLRKDGAGDTLEFGSDSPRSSFNQALAGLTASYYRPFGVRWQLNVTSSFLFPVRPDDEKKNQFSWNSRASLEYAIADRWSASCDLYHRRTNLTYQPGYYGPLSTDNSWSAAVYAQVSYYLEDNLHAYLNADYQAHGWRDRETLSYDRMGNQSALSFRLGLSYAFIGAPRGGRYYY